MKPRTIAAFACAALAAACAEKETDINALSDSAPAPTSEEFAKMAKFSRRPDIKREKGTSGYHFKLGEALWVYRYTSRGGDGRHSYVLGLYKGGTLFGGDRAEVEESTRRRIERMKNLSEEALEELAGQTPEEREEMRKFLALDRVDTRRDGRTVYFCFMGHRGEAMDMTAAGFSTIGSHDLLLWHCWERARYDGQFKKEPEPACELPEIFKKIERHLAAHEGAEAAP